MRSIVRTSQHAWFRELPTGVLDSLTPEQVMHCYTEEECTQLVRLLPPTEAALLDWTINLMADVVEHEDHQCKKYCYGFRPKHDAESSMPGNESQNVEKKKPRPRDVFGRTLTTEEEFQVLKTAPRLETGMPARSKSFGIEVRNVKCARCGNFGHQSGDRECPLKDVIMPNEENRLKRDDPLTAILAHTDVNEPLKWELKQKPGISPPRGGFKPDDPPADSCRGHFRSIWRFLSGGIIYDLLTNFSVIKTKNHSKSKTKHKSRSLADSETKVRHKNRSLSPSDSEPHIERISKKKMMKEKKHKKSTRQISSSSSSGIRKEPNPVYQRIQTPAIIIGIRHHKRTKAKLLEVEISCIQQKFSGFQFVQNFTKTK